MQRPARVQRFPTTTARGVTLAALVVVTAGCFGPQTVRYEMLPVDGVLTLDGRPLANADVILESETGPRGFGTTDQSGKFSVSTRQFGAGLPAGTYKVFVRGTDKTHAGAGPVAVAAAYRDAGVGKVTIGPGSGPLTFDLKHEPAGARAEARDGSER